METNDRDYRAEAVRAMAQSTVMTTDQAAIVAALGALTNAMLAIHQELRQISKDLAQIRANDSARP